MRRRFHGILLALVAVLAAACGTTPTAPPPAAETSSYRIGPPDGLDITVLPDPVIQRNVVVRPDGMISIDLVGDVPVAGRTTDEVARDIQQRIGRFKRDASVNVSLTASRSTEITVLGEVGRQTTFALAKETRLIEALGTVGGVKRFGDKENIRLIRFSEGETQVHIADMAAIEHGDLSTNFLLQGGDVIVVPPTAWAEVGYAMQVLFYPFQQLLGMGSRVTTTVVTGGVF